MNEITRAMSIDPGFWRYALVVPVVLMAAVTDARSYRIPNVLTLPLIASGVAFHTLASPGEGWVFSCSGLIVGSAPLFFLFAAGGVGAGDVKLLSGIGAWVGPHDALVVFAMAGLLTGIWSLAVLIRRSGRLQDPAHSPSGVADRAGIDAVSEGPAPRHRLVPMGTMIALAIALLLTAAWVTAEPAGP